MGRTRSLPGTHQEPSGSPMSQSPLEVAGAALRLSLLDAQEALVVVVHLVRQLLEELRLAPVLKATTEALDMKTPQENPVVEEVVREQSAATHRMM